MSEQITFSFKKSTLKKIVSGISMIALTGLFLATPHIIHAAGSDDISITSQGKLIINSASHGNIIIDSKDIQNLANYVYDAASDYKTDVAYSEGALVNYNGNLYKCSANITASANTAFSTDSFAKTSVTKEIASLSSEIDEIKDKMYFSYNIVTDTDGTFLEITSVE